MKRILMATDLSARSDRALERALRLAADHGGEVTVVHVVDAELPASLADAQAQAAKQAIREHIATLTAAEGLQVSAEVVFGRAYLGILDMSEKMDAELILLGLHREDAFRDMFRGTTAERVIRAGDVPVLLVKERASGPYQRIMVGVDFSVYSRRAVEFAVGFAPTARFHLVHAYDVPFKGFLHGQDTRREISKQHETQFQNMVEEEMAAFLSTLDAKTPELERIMEHGVVREVIHRQVDRLKPDLLVVGTHGRTGVAHALLGSVAENLLREPPCDVLAVNAW
ncbi:MAG: universal stress protein [Kiloniellales bacterium]|nr:universal stress protein [Kiloniellales bacterium]